MREAVMNSRFSLPFLLLILLMMVMIQMVVAQDTSPSLESTGVLRHVYRSGNAPPPALAPDMSDGSGDYLDYTDMSPQIGSRVEPRLRSDPAPASGSGSGPSSGESGLRAQVRGKPKTTSLGNFRRNGMVYSRYRMESIVEVPIATIDAYGKMIPLKQQRFPLPVPSFPHQLRQQTQPQQQPQQQPYVATPPTVRSLQEQVLEPPIIPEPDAKQPPAPNTAPDGSQYYVVQNPDGSQNLVIKAPGQPAMMTPLPKAANGQPPQQYIIRQGPVPGMSGSKRGAAQPPTPSPAAKAIQGSGRSGRGGRQKQKQPQPQSGSAGSSRESASLQDKYSEKPPDVLINYGDDLQTGELGKTLDHGRVSIPKVDPKERAELLKERDETQDQMKKEWNEKLEVDDHMDTED